MEIRELTLGIALNRKTNKLELVILDKTGHGYSADLEKLKEHMENYFNEDFEFLKEEYFLDELTQKFNISLDEIYKIIKLDLLMATINELLFDKERKGTIYFLDSDGLYTLYKEIFSGTLDQETFKKILLEMLIRRYYLYAFMDTFERIRQFKSFIGNI